MAMTDPQTRRPASESPADDPRIEPPGVRDARPARGGSTGLPRAVTLGVAIAIVGIVIIIIMMLAR
jgi:hypothetical protein